MKKFFKLIVLLIVIGSLFPAKSLYSQKISPSIYFKAVNDTVDLVPGFPVTIDLMANDTIPAGDTITLTGGNPSNCGAKITVLVNGSIYTYTAGTGYNGTCHGRYILRHIGGGTVDTSSAGILFRIRDHGFDSLYLNNINARFSARGNHFFYENAKFEVPKFSGKTTIFSNALWIGGMSEDSVLHLAAERYGQGPNTAPALTKLDYSVGPVMDSSAYSIVQDTTWNYIWNLTKSEIDYHKSHWGNAGYQPIHDILTWPGNGNVALGQAPILAPFYDRNNDGHYDPMDGDYPLIKGDQSLFFIFNDDRKLHEETEGNKMKVEIHGMAYAFDIPGDSAFWNTLFLNYKIYNRSQRTYYNTYLGTFTDIDLGWSRDDFVGCDVQRGCFFGYNGTPIDGNGQPEAYGENPPAQSVTILAGPFMDPDGIDNPKKDNSGNQLCNESVNGFGFGDDIVDNERYGMRKFVYINNSLSGVPAYMQDPNYAQEYYNLMKGIWKDGTRMVYGGNGNLSAGGYGPACDFMFPGLSDTLNWGAGCQTPNGPVNWTEETAGNNPSDRRAMASMGPFTFHPGDVQDVEMAFTFARDYGNKTPMSSLEKLKEMITITRTSFETNTLPNGQSFNGINDTKKVSTGHAELFPNPAHNYTTVKFDQSIYENVRIELIGFDGAVLSAYDVNPCGNKTMLNLSSLSNGIYMVTIRAKDFFTTEKLVVFR